MNKIAPLPIFTLLLLVVGYSSALAEELPPASRFSLNPPPYRDPYAGHPSDVPSPVIVVIPGRPHRFELPPRAVYHLEPWLQLNPHRPEFGRTYVSPPTFHDRD